MVTSASPDGVRLGCQQHSVGRPLVLAYGGAGTAIGTYAEVADIAGRATVRELSGPAP